MRFVIIASPRTGSSHLVNMLGGHPEIFCNGNVFHPKHVWVFWPDSDLGREVKAELLRLRNTDPMALLERVFATNYGRPHVGFKIFEGQNDEILQKLIGDEAVRKIVLYRKNVLANYSSKIVARKTDKFNAREGEQGGEVTKIQFVPGKFVSFHARYNAFYRGVIDRLNQNRQHFHLIDYDEINDPSLLAALTTFIGADPSRESVELDQDKRHVKQNPSDICSRFSNPEEVRDFLVEHGLLHWAHEGETSLGRLSFTSTAKNDARSAAENPVSAPSTEVSLSGQEIFNEAEGH